MHNYYFIKLLYHKEFSEKSLIPWNYTILNKIEKKFKS